VSINPAPSFGKVHHSFLMAKFRVGVSHTTVLATRLASADRISHVDVKAAAVYISCFSAVLQCEMLLAI